MRKLHFIGYPRLRISEGDDGKIVGHPWHRSAGHRSSVGIIENLTQRPATESNNRKVISMVENIISGLYLVGDVALLGLLVYNSRKPHNKIKRGWRDIYQSEPIKGLREHLHGLQGPQEKR